METMVIKGGRQSPNSTQQINFSDVPDDIRINYCQIVLKSKLTEYLRGLFKKIYQEYETKLDLINAVDNISKHIRLDNFIYVDISNNYIFILGNMMYNELYRMILHLKALYDFDEIDYDKVLYDFSLVKNDISKDLLSILTKSV